MKTKTRSLAELQSLAASGADVVDKDGIGVRFAVKKTALAAAPAPTPEPPNAEIAGALDRFSLSLGVLLSSSQVANANLAEIVMQMRKDLAQSVRAPKPSSWVFDVKRDGNGNMTITANPK